MASGHHAGEGSAFMRGPAIFIARFLLVSSSLCKSVSTLPSWILVLCTLSIAVSPWPYIPFKLHQQRESHWIRRLPPNKEPSWSEFSCKASSNLAKPMVGCLWHWIQSLKPSSVAWPTRSHDIKHGCIVQWGTVLDNLHLLLQINSPFFFTLLCALGLASGHKKGGTQ